MKLVWCPELASKAYIDGVRVLADHDGPAEVAELVSAMAGGWNAQLIVEAPYVDSEPDQAPSSSSSSSSSATRPPAATSLALAAAARRTGGRYACVLPDAAFAAVHDPAAAEAAVVVGDADAAMARLEGVDLLVVDARRRDAEAVLRAARPGPRGMVVVRHGDVAAGSRQRRGAVASVAATGAGTRVVRSVYLPIGKGGVEVLHVGVGKGPSLQASRSRGRAAGRWIRHVNHDTGEEHVFRRQ